MCKILKPKVYLHSIYNIDLSKLKEIKKIKGIIIDLDNTLVPYGQNEIDQKIVEWINEALKLDFKLCIVSNSNSQRAKKFSHLLNIPYYSKFFKPMKVCFDQGLRILGTSKDETVVIGDQVFTDVWGGNRVELFTILVTPLIPRDALWTYPQRTLERIILAYWKNKNIVLKEKGNWPK